MDELSDKQLHGWLVFLQGEDQSISVEVDRLIQMVKEIRWLRIKSKRIKIPRTDEELESFLEDPTNVVAALAQGRFEELVGLYIDHEMKRVH